MSDAFAKVPGLDTPRAAVLVVDDVEANLVAMEALLGDLRCDVVRASSGNGALRQLLRREFAVILLDVQMPSMDGYEVALHARKNPATREVPIIFLTATHHDEDNVLRGYGSGAVDYLFKPINPTILRSKVQIFLEQYDSRGEIAAAKRALERSNHELRELATAKDALAQSYLEANERLEAAYRELQTTQAQLIQSAKMASLGQLVAGVAHEINNPLAFALSHLDTARKSIKSMRSEIPAPLSETAQSLADRAENRLAEMVHGLERIRELVLKLRTFSRLDEGERKVASVRECVDSVLTILHHRIEPRLRLDVSVGDPEYIDCYPGLLNQALMNLVTNAIEAIEGPGSIAIEAGADGGVYRICVADSGNGIPEDLRSRVLDPFFTTKPVGVGTGLGLSISYSIAQKHGGTLELVPREGGGTLARLAFPIAGRA